MKSLIVKTSLLMMILLASGCTAMHSIMSVGTGVAQSLSGVAIVDGRFRVEFVECIGSASSQSVVAILTVTNIGPNVTNIFIGGSSDNTLAIDGYGVTYKPYSSSGMQYALPTNVAVRVLVEKIGPILPNVGAFRSLRVNIGGGKYSVAEFRNIPVLWSN